MTSFKKLLAVCASEDVAIKHLTMLSICAVFTDIIPGYRIRLPTARELEVKVSREVKKLRDYEAAFLLYYQKYLKVLEGASKGAFSVFSCFFIFVSPCPAWSTLVLTTFQSPARSSSSLCSA